MRDRGALERSRGIGGRGGGGGKRGHEVGEEEVQHADGCTLVMLVLVHLRF